MPYVAIHQFKKERAGRERNVFTPEAKQGIFEIAKGVLRELNDRCDLSLLIELSRNTG